jgi:hypothetical protein
VKTPARPNSEEGAALWRRALGAWREKGPCAACPNECWCQFSFVCTACGDPIKAIGEDMPAYEQTGGQCVSCFYFDADGNPRD